jgi:NTP pyrophosphatase (non-canonical NTP hydrolase)
MEQYNLTPFPTDTTLVPDWIWNAQNELNRVSHPAGKGTLEFKPDADQEVILKAFAEYEAALLGEVSELQDSFFWKHWSAEAKAGGHWDVIDDAARQNVKVEIADMLFFLVSILHLAECGFQGTTFHDTWVALAARPSPEPVGFSKESNCAANVEARSCLGEVMGLVRATNLGNMPIIGLYARQAITHFFSLAYTYFTPDELYDAYRKKLIINFERMKRSRQQVGDKLAEKENQTI